CGNFLIIAYRELRELEILVLKVLYSQDQRVLDVNEMSHIDVDQFHGIEFEEFPARIAEVALWLVDHQMNMKLSEAFGQYYVRIPLRKSAHIVHGNALTLDWKEVVQPSQLSYILGNPPFVGHQYRSESQATDMKLIWGIDGKFRRLDYVTCWYQKAAHYLEHNRKIVAAFVSTNSITQGEQASILWSELFANKVYIHFAHRTFQWASDARGKAAVHCVIIGFALYDILSKALFDYDTPKSAPHLVQAKNINGYLIDALNIALPSRTKPRNGFPQMLKGSQPTDGGYLILSDLEKEQLIRQEPAAADWIKQYIGGEELLSGKTRWCLWLKGISPTELKEMSKVLERVEGVKTVRLKSSTKSVR
ncbi:MAG: DNA methyltransferase, partial [Chitinophagaceae bacterium]